MKKVLITGASGAIGRAIAEYFVEKGYKVFAGYCKNKPEIDGAESIFIDVTDKNSIKDALKYMGGVDVLVNNAGISEQKLFTDIEEEDWDRIFSVNIKGMYMVTKEAISQMISKKSGRIINISSTNGDKTIYPTSIDYDASKAAINNLTKNFAIEFAPYVLVNAIMPQI